MRNSENLSQKILDFFAMRPDIVVHLPDTVVERALCLDSQGLCDFAFGEMVGPHLEYTSAVRDQLIQLLVKLFKQKVI